MSRTYLAFCGAAAAMLTNAVASPSSIAECRSIGDAQVRLACYDAIATPSAAPQAAVPRTLPVQQPAPAIAPSATRAPPSRRQRPRFRLAMGYGLGIASHDGTFKVQHGPLHTQSGFGNAGQSYFAQGWLTGWPGRDWQVGLEYLHLQNVGTINMLLPNGLSILTDPVVGQIRAEVIGDLGLVNLAYAPDTGGRLRPYLGLGLGAGYGFGHFRMEFTNDFIGKSTTVSDGASFFAGVQGVLGADIRLSDHYYLGLQTKALYITAHPIGVDQRYLDFILALSLGRTF
jgi:hypothetical protein